MTRRRQVRRFAAALPILALLACEGARVPEAEAGPQQQARPSQQGEASYYGREFNGRKMANGEQFDPGAHVAAHRTLPLGTTARVTNLRNGRTTTVTVKDRGPYARGRVLDVSPRVADELAMKEDGVAPVRVTPVAAPGQGDPQQ